MTRDELRKQKHEEFDALAKTQIKQQLLLGNPTEHTKVMKIMKDLDWDQDFQKETAAQGDKINIETLSKTYGTDEIYSIGQINSLSRKYALKLSDSYAYKNNVTSAEKAKISTIIADNLKTMPNVDYFTSHDFYVLHPKENGSNIKSMPINDDAEILVFLKVMTDSREYYYVLVARYGTFYKSRRVFLGKYCENDSFSDKCNIVASIVAGLIALIPVAFVIGVSLLSMSVTFFLITVCTYLMLDSTTNPLFNLKNKY